MFVYGGKITVGIDLDDNVAVVAHSHACACGSWLFDLCLFYLVYFHYFRLCSVY